MKNIKLFFLLSLVALLSSACNEQIKQEAIIHNAVAIESGDECHLCGMLISNFDGPKGEIFKKGFANDKRNKVHKFCSTRDLFSFYLDPEHTRNVETVLVHDMSKMPWNSLQDEFFIDAKTAWFVSGSNKTGAMGKTLVSFGKKVDAQTFADKFGGQVLAFKDVTISVLM